MKVSLTDAQAATLRSALSRAIDERVSYADAWQDGTPERRRALKEVAKIEALHMKLFGGKSYRALENERIASLPTVSIFDLHKEPQP